MNKVILMGRMTKDPEVRYTQQGTAIASFTLAVDRRGAKDGQQTADFINCQAWQKLAETIGNHCHKGIKILVEGRMQVRSYQAQDGSNRWITEVVVNNMEFAESKKNSGGQDAGYQQGYPQSAPIDEEIPF